MRSLLNTLWRISIQYSNPVENGENARVYYRRKREWIYYSADNKIGIDCMFATVAATINEQCVSNLGHQAQKDARACAYRNVCSVQRTKCVSVFV